MELVSEFEHADFTCRVRRHPTLGHLNGYVVVPGGHPWHECGYAALEHVSVHGGVTFGDRFTADGPWEVGFDTAHRGDIRLAMLGDTSMPLIGKLRRAEFVRKQCHSLAEQARDAAEAEAGGGAS